MIGACVALLFLSGCATQYSSVPSPTNFPTAEQQKLQAASHWNTIAQNVADRMGGKIADASALYVNVNEEQTDFERAFANQLTTSLVEAGYSVMTSPDRAMIVELDIQAVEFTANRPKYSHSSATALGAGLFVLYEIAESDPVLATALALGAADAFGWFHSKFPSGAIPRTEIIVNVSISNSDQFVVRSTDVYYVAGTDMSLYELPSAPKPMTTIQVTGG